MDIDTYVYAGNLAFDITEQILRQEFSSVGTVAEITIAKDPSSGRFRGFAFVKMDSKQEAEKAIDALQNRTLNGRAIFLAPAKAEMDLWEDTFGKEA